MTLCSGQNTMVNNWCIPFEQGVDGLPVAFVPVNDMVMGGLSTSQFTYDAEQVGMPTLTTR